MMKLKTINITCASIVMTGEKMIMDIKLITKLPTSTKPDI